MPAAAPSAEPRRRPARRAAIALLLLLCVGTIASRAHAQGDPDGASGAGSDAALDLFSVPESPAALLLDASPASVARPTTTRELTAALLNAVGPDGRVKQGVAVEVAPSLLWRTSLAQYRASGLRRALHRAQLSLATARSSGDSAATDVALGLRVQLVQAADPITDPRFADALFAAAARCPAPAAPPLPPPGGAPPPPVAADPARTACLEAALDSVARDYARARWNAAHLVVAAAAGTRLAALDQAPETGLGAYVTASGGIPLGDWGQLLLAATLHDRRLTADAERTTLFSYGNRLIVGSDRLNLFGEVTGQSRLDGPEVGSKTTLTWVVGLELRLARGVWLATGLGDDERQRELGLGGAPSLLVANLRWGLADRARLDRTGR